MKKSDIKDVKDLDIYYDKARKIKFSDKVEIKEVSDIIKNLFEEPSSKTFRTRNGQHCNSEKQRSIDDYFLLCKFYFPRKKIKTFVKLLQKYEKNRGQNRNNYFYFRYCPNIKKTNNAGRIFYWKSNRILNENLPIRLGPGCRVFLLKEIINY